MDDELSRRMVSVVDDEGVLLGNTRPSTQPPGRGTLVSRRLGAELVQVAYSPVV
jgi:S-DNA-T family DNA segregation ATPase FtsK/SpoIIIE